MASLGSFLPRTWKLQLRAWQARLNGEASQPLAILYHPPAQVSRRCDDFSCNLPGRLARTVTSARFKINDGDWRDVAQGGPRVQPPEFILELSADDLRFGPNRLVLEAHAHGRSPETIGWDFTYDPEPVTLPHLVDWDVNHLEVEDGYWERFRGDDDVFRVRPVPGCEGYDRVLIVAGAFSGGRRLETDVIYRYNTGSSEWGFGLLPLWGGRLDDAGNSPKRGWLFSLGWYFNRYRGVGSEFSLRHGTDPARFCTAYRSLQIVPGQRYRLLMECRPVQDRLGNHQHYQQRLKWWPANDEEPDAWIELSDSSGWPLPVRDYGVACVCYGCQAEFGPVSIQPLQPLQPEV